MKYSKIKRIIKNCYLSLTISLTLTVLFCHIGYLITDSISLQKLLYDYHTFSFICSLVLFIILLIIETIIDIKDLKERK